MKKREAIVEGIFYPEDREKLADTVLTYIHSPNTGSSPRQPEAADVFGLIVPHAGYNYCGEHTGRAFSRAAGNQVETILLLGPVHRDPEEGIFLSESEQFLSPLGPIYVNQEINEELLSTSTTITRNDIPHLEEHSLEVQIPFIQILFPKADIVPILMGIPSPGTIHALARALDLILPDRLDSTLVIVSGNASTFIEKKRAGESAEIFKNCVEKGDSETLIRGIQDRSINSCGAGIAASVLNLKSIRLRGRLVSEGSSHSGDSTDKHTVHYASFELIENQNSKVD